MKGGCEQPPCLLWRLSYYRMEHTLNLTENLAMQDLVRAISTEMKLSPTDAVIASITRENLQKAVKEGYGSIAVGLWGHDNGFEFTPLDNPVLHLDIPEPESKRIKNFMKAMDREETTVDDAIFEFLIFQADKLGFHI